MTALPNWTRVFALALFCQLKGIGYKEATRHLKKHLRRSYKKAVKQIEEETESKKL